MENRVYQGNGKGRGREIGTGCPEEGGIGNRETMIGLPIILTEYQKHRIASEALSDQLREAIVQRNRWARIVENLKALRAEELAYGKTLV